MNCQFPYKRSFLCQCLKINWNNICCYYINSIYNVCVFYYYYNVMSVWSGQDVSFFVLCVSWFLLFVLLLWAASIVEPMAFFGSLSYLTNKYACLLLDHDVKATTIWPRGAFPADNVWYQIAGDMGEHYQNWCAVLCATVVCTYTRIGVLADYFWIYCSLFCIPVFILIRPVCLFCVRISFYFCVLHVTLNHVSGLIAFVW